MTVDLQTIAKLTGTLGTPGRRAPRAQRYVLRKDVDSTYSVVDRTLDDLTPPAGMTYANALDALLELRLSERS